MRLLFNGNRINCTCYEERRLGAYLRRGCCLVVGELPSSRLADLLGVEPSAIRFDLFVFYPQFCGQLAMSHRRVPANHRVVVSIVNLGGEVTTDVVSDLDG